MSEERSKPTLFDEIRIAWKMVRKLRAAPESSNFQCPTCYSQEVHVEIPLIDCEPRWFIECRWCGNRYLLDWNGTIQFVGR